MKQARNYAPSADVMADRVVLVTGASSGIGREVSLALASHGANVVALARTRDKLESLCSEIEAAGGPEPMAVEADLEKMTWDDHLALAEALDERYGRLDGLLHNAGILGHRSPIAHYDTMTWHRVMHVNVNAAFLLTRALLPSLGKSPDATVVFTSSGVGREGRAFWGAYAVSKFATEGLMQVLAQETQQSGPRVNCINPGPTRTSMRAAAYPAEDPETLVPPAALLPVYLYLLGPASRGVSGRSIDCQ